jgi:hypothetical protein
MFYVRQSNCKIMGLLYGWVLMQYLRLTKPMDRQMLNPYRPRQCNNRFFIYFFMLILIFSMEFKILQRFTTNLSNYQ